ncbi:hypothetical protein ACN20G_23590 [Streptomyces sp. BI20]|uniref:hypothetical protein n=1 Tax=Streptomyces sp. BI20 TaxID=3403460 RepID=UPI003C77112D
MSENPFGQSPWDEPANDNTPTSNQESPVTVTTATPAHEGVTLSFKGGSGYDASLLVLRASTITEMGQMLDSEREALMALMKRMAKVQTFNNGLNAPAKTVQAGKNTFSGGKVQNSGGDGGHKGVTDCEHGRTHVAKGTWEAYFCNADERKGEDKCPPAFLNNKSGKFEVKG